MFSSQTRRAAYAIVRCHEEATPEKDANEMAAEHKFLKFILPTTVFEKIKADTKKWLIECPCGYKRDLWDTGGVRYKAIGEPRQFNKCPECNQGTWHKIRKKTESEKQQIL